MTTASEVQALAREVTQQPAELFAPEDAPQPSLPRRSDDLCIAHLLSETSGLWTAHEQAARGARIQLYAFLGAVYEHGAAVAQNELALAELRRNVGQLYATARWQRTASTKSARELLLLAAMGLAQPSLRSKYKRVLLEASKANVPPDRESFKLWIQEARGIVEILGTALPAGDPDDTYSEVTAASLESRRSDLPVRSSGRNEAIAAVRRDLMAKSVKSMSIPMIENAPPADTFAIVVYRADAGRLVPCLWSDETADIDAFLRSVVRRRNSDPRPPTTATSDSDSRATYKAATREAA